MKIEAIKEKIARKRARKKIEKTARKLVRNTYVFGKEAAATLVSMGIATGGLISPIDGESLTDGRFDTIYDELTNAIRPWLKGVILEIADIVKEEMKTEKNEDDDASEMDAE